MLLPRRFALAALMTTLFALPAQGQSATGRASVLAQARVVQPALAIVVFETAEGTTASAEQGDAERRAERLVISGTAGASLGVTLREGNTVIASVRMRLDPEPRRISIPVPVCSRAREVTSATPLIVELVYLGL